MRKTITLIPKGFLEQPGLATFLNANRVGADLASGGTLCQRKDARKTMPLESLINPSRMGLGECPPLPEGQKTWGQRAPANVEDLSLIGL